MDDQPAPSSNAVGVRSPISAIPRANLKPIQTAVMHHTYRGVLCNKNPFDLALYPKLLWESRPATIIEIGSKEGGSALWFDDVSIRLGLNARIISIDINQRANVRRKNISFYQQDARNLSNLLTPDFLSNLSRPWLVVEDADHHYLTTKAVIEFFTPLLRAGEYLAIEDGICDSFGNEGRYDGGPNRAIAEMLERDTPPFQIATEWCDYFGYNVTWNTNGYLRRL